MGPPSWACFWIPCPKPLVFSPNLSIALRKYPGSGAAARRKEFTANDSDDSPVTPKAPDVTKETTASPMAMAAGTKTGLKIRNRGVITARPSALPAKVRPARSSRKPARGRRAMTARTWEVDGPFWGRRVLTPAL